VSQAITYKVKGRFSDRQRIVASLLFKSHWAELVCICTIAVQVVAVAVEEIDNILLVMPKVTHSVVNFRLFVALNT